MNHSIQCSCGKLKGSISNANLVNRCVCYCKDCQAFAHFLKRGTEILDASGGTEIIQMTPASIHFEQGSEHLACMRLSEKGLIRWYTSCCYTPIGNTLPNFKISFIGVISVCLKTNGESLENSFGPIRAHTHTKSALGKIKPKQHGMFSTGLRILRMALRARFNGSYKVNPFFNSETGKPISEPKINEKTLDSRSSLE